MHIVHERADSFFPSRSLPLEWPASALNKKQPGDEPGCWRVQGTAATLRQRSSQGAFPDTTRLADRAAVRLSRFRRFHDCTTQMPVAYPPARSE
ncbi:hypothetical protein OF001_U110067 [Pseudomonas sp. OF001]|nr:hypothetical protein OF001_U110067 [Pseudomonas sp. OF001]